MCYGIYLSANKEHDTCKFIIANFCVNPEKVNFFHQLKQAKKLYAFFPDPLFWKWIVRNRDDYKVYTLVKYLETERFKYLKEIKSIKEFDLKKNETFKIEKEKIGEDKQIERKPQNIIDFLKNG